MNVAAGPELAAAVTNAGGLGVIGGVGYTPKILRQQVSLAFPLLLSFAITGCAEYHCKLRTETANRFPHCLGSSLTSARVQKNIIG